MEEIRIAKLYDNSTEQVKIEFLDTISVKEFELIKSSIQEIEELHSVRRLLKFVVINDAELIDFLNSSLHDLTNKSIIWTGVKREDCDNVFLNINRLFLNYLSAIRTFLDHSETFLNRKFGENSNQFLEFKKILSFFYDNSFSYRFFYRLRNYAQHVGLPIDNLQFSTEYDREKNTIHGNLKVRFDRDKLLSSYQKWSTVKNDLEMLDSKFDVSPLIFEMTQNITDIERNIELIHKNELTKAANYILSLTQHLRNDNGKIFVASNFIENEKEELANYSTTEIPFDTIDFIIQELN
ncbi:hypothetical protein [Flavobacterium marginilacus]|uniref:hypothetical protein n=1 Tax=Flavobacterium marginilacus TaxID=3003256 RepID=UPI00248F2F26|nr:hypothetical protein [Flavobacterium marginilacus]